MARFEIGVIATPKHLVSGFENRSQVRIVALVELLAEIVPDVPYPDNPLIVDVEFPADLPIGLAGQITAQEARYGFGGLLDFGLDMIELTIIPAAIFTQIRSVSVNAMFLPG